MFKFSWKFRKILRKLYHFIGFMSLFLLFLSPVKADCVSVLDGLYDPPFYYISNYAYLTKNGTSDGHFDLEANTTYTFFLLNENNEVVSPMIQSYSQMFFVARYGSIYLSSGADHYTFTTDSTNLFFNAAFYGSSNNFRLVDFPFYNSTTPMLVVGDSTCIPSPPTPPTPPSNEIYDSFLDVFLDRFSYLATNFTSNPYLFAFVGILMSWVILELFLRIFHIRGGYKK